MSYNKISFPFEKIVAVENINLSLFTASSTDVVIHTTDSNKGSCFITDAVVITRSAISGGTGAALRFGINGGAGNFFTNADLSLSTSLASGSVGVFNLNVGATILAPANTGITMSNNFASGPQTGIVSIYLKLIYLGTI